MHIKVTAFATNLSLYDLQKKVRVAAAAECVSNTMGLIENFQLF